MNQNTDSSYSMERSQKDNK